MATISELNHALSDTLTVPLATVKVFSRQLRENKFLSQKGHGRGAANATPLDAARMIIALMATTSPAKAVKCVTSFGQLTAHAVNMEENAKPGEVENLGLRMEQTFEDGLATLLKGLADPKFVSFIQRHDGWSSSPDKEPDLTVQLTDAVAIAGIEMPGVELVYSPNPCRRIDLTSDEVCGGFSRFMAAIRPFHQGIESTRTVRAPPILEISKLVNGRSMFDVLRDLPAAKSRRE